jgi:hypothetical protein
LAFVLSRGRSSICEKISQFGTTKVSTEQYCNTSKYATTVRKQLPW